MTQLFEIQTSSLPIKDDQPRDKERNFHRVQFLYIRTYIGTIIADRIVDTGKRSFTPSIQTLLSRTDTEFIAASKYELAEIKSVPIPGFSSSYVYVRQLRRSLHIQRIYIIYKGPRLS